MSRATNAPISINMRRQQLQRLPPLPTLQPPVQIRRAHKGDAAALADLLGRAYPDETWTVSGTEVELFADNTVHSTLVADRNGRLLATASLQVLEDSPTIGRVRWVATEASHRRQGLGRALVIGVLQAAAAQGCQTASLRTETNRQAAIALYLQLGFEQL